MGFNSGFKGLNTVGILGCVLTCWYVAVLTLRNTVFGGFSSENLTFMPCASAQRKHHLTEDCHPVDDRARCFRFPGWSVIFFLYFVSYVLAVCHTDIPTQWMSPSPPGHDSEQRNAWIHTSTFLHVVCGLCLITHTNGVNVRVTYLPTSCSVSSGLRRRTVRQTAVTMLEECVARRFRAEVRKFVGCVG